MATIAPDRIVELGLAFRSAKALQSAVELGVFTALTDEPLDASALAQKTGIHVRGARDFFDALVALRFLERDDHGRYSNAPESAFFLDRHKKTYIGGELEHLGAYVYPRWSFLTQALRTGEAQSGTRATGHYSALYADEEALASVAKGMSGGSLLAARALARSFDWSVYQTFVDIGSAQGCLPVQVALSHQHLTGGGFDLPAMRPYFERYVSEHGLSPRLRFFSGDFLNDPLPSADILVFGRILHNWDLATKQDLLRKAYKALPDEGALIIYERFIDDERRNSPGALLASLNMLIMTAGGFDFTGAECIDWMKGVGFRNMQLTPLAGELSMIVALK
jgi:O-methyltransferase/methyltransferase family protein